MASFGYHLVQKQQKSIFHSKVTPSLIMKWEVECSETGTDIFQESLIQMRKRNSFFFCFSVVVENELMTLSRNYWHQLKCLSSIYKSLECFLFVQRFMTAAPQNHYFREWEFELFDRYRSLFRTPSNICLEFFAIVNDFNPLSASPIKWSNTLKQVGKLSANCLSVFDHFVGLTLEGLSRSLFLQNAPS